MVHQFLTRHHSTAGFARLLWMKVGSVAEALENVNQYDPENLRGIPPASPPFFLWKKPASSRGGG